VPASRPEKVARAVLSTTARMADVLTRGDQSRLRILFHDLYLYVALTKPDLSQVETWTTISTSPCAMPTSRL